MSDEVIEDQAAETAETNGTSDAAEAAEDVRSEFVMSFADPISDDAPCGESVRYEEEFEKIKAEIDRLSENDFELVAELSTGLLKEKTKDLMVASYMAYALTRLDGVSGLVEGIGVLNLLMETFWEDVFPKRVNGRSNALQFFVQRSAEVLEGHKPTADERDDVAIALSRIETFQTFVMEAMEENAPAVSGLKRVLTEIERRLPKPEVEEKPAADSGGDGPSASSGQPEEIQSKSDASKVLLKVCSYLREEDVSSPTPYRLMRAHRWSGIVAVPPNTDGKTRIPAPLEQRRTYLETLLEGDDPDTLLKEAEASFQQGSFHFWFELQRMIASAMDALGEEFNAARQAILQDTALLINRMPELLELSYADGTPFVSPLCREWMEADVVSLLGQASESEARPSTEESDETPGLEAQRKEAVGLLNKGDLQGAISLLRSGGDNDRSARDRFLRQLYLADLCVKGKRPSIARTILEGLDVSIERHGLSDWEPDLALEAWSALHGCYKALQAKAPQSEKAEIAKAMNGIFDKICRVDAGYALSL